MDFWWDQYPTNSGNCWYPNIGSNGKPDGITSDPPPPPAPGATVPGFLPEDCGSPLNVGTGNMAKEAMLVSCAAAGEMGSYDPNTCEWFAPPARPGSAAAARQRAEERDTAESLVGRINVDRFCQLLGGSGGTLTCSPFRHRL